PATGKQIRELRGHRSIVQCVAFSPDSRTLASGSGNWRITGEGDNTIRLWDIARGEEIRRPQGHQCSLTSVGFAPDGRTLVSASKDSSIHFWDAATGKELSMLPCKPSPTSGPDRSRLWGSPVWGMVFSTDGKLLAACGADKTVWLWGVGTGKVRRLWGHQ